MKNIELPTEFKFRYNQFRFSSPIRTKFMKIFRYLLLLFLLSVLSCTQIPQDLPGIDVSEGTDFDSQPTNETSPPTLTPRSTQTASPSAPLTATPTVIPPTITPTPSQLSVFSAPELRVGVSPAVYIDDPCSYLENRWGEGKSPPGTIVVPIMFHSVAKPGREFTEPSTISMAYFEYFMQRAEELGFSTVTIEDLIGFLEDNQEIPERSMLLILDDRRPGVTELFMPYLEQNDWTLTLAWPTTDATNDELWERMEGLAESGRLDVQSHGHDHIYIQGYTEEKEIEEEIYKPIEVIEAHFGTTPRALIWPGGNYTDGAIQMAETAGFKVGFTVYSRGPLMYNWIPQGEEERAINIPLMTLPRYWSKDADIALEQALAIGEAAQQDAQKHKYQELQYLEVYCRHTQETD
jgi:peptidoglycan/xylan/chitin deacetylase (PgdA/CDA1 family)